MRVAVVGAGIAGSSAAFELSRRGHDVTIYEQFPPGHDRGSSHGNSRIVRKAYPDAFYTEHMLRAYPLWAELDRLAGGGILYECGLLYFGSADAPNVIDLVQGLKDLGVEHRAYDASTVAEVMPSLRLEPGEIAVFTPEAGWVNAARALETLLSQARDRGAVLVSQRVEDLLELEREFDTVALCPGGWIKKFIPDLPVTPTVQTFAYVRHRQEGPVWIEDSDDGMYGFPSEPGASSIKIGVHRHGPVLDPDEAERTLLPEYLERIADISRRRFRATGELHDAKGCIYTSTPTEDFCFGRTGQKTFYASACSGHGFKFGPWVGKLLADFIEETDSPERYPRFMWLR